MWEKGSTESSVFIYTSALSFQSRENAQFVESGHFAGTIGVDLVGRVVRIFNSRRILTTSIWTHCAVRKRPDFLLQDGTSGRSTEAEAMAHAVG